MVAAVLCVVVANTQNANALQDGKGGLYCWRCGVSNGCEKEKATRLSKLSDLDKLKRFLHSYGHAHPTAELPVHLLEQVHKATTAETVVTRGYTLDGASVLSHDFIKKEAGYVNIPSSVVSARKNETMPDAVLRAAVQGNKYVQYTLDVTPDDEKNSLMFAFMMEQRKQDLIEEVFSGVTSKRRTTLILFGNQKQGTGLHYDWTQAENVAFGVEVRARVLVCVLVCGWFVFLFVWLFIASLHVLAVVRLFLQHSSI